MLYSLSLVKYQNRKPRNGCTVRRLKTRTRKPVNGISLTRDVAKRMIPSTPRTLAER